MADVLLQFASLLVFIFGIILGEFLAHRAFGVPKNGKAVIIDVFLIVFIITVFYSYVGFYGTGPLYFLTNFLFGSVSVLCTRAVLWVSGMTKTETIKPGRAVEIIRTLARHGVEEEEIKNILKKMGLKQDAVDRYQHLIERTVPAYMPKIVKMEKTLERMEKRLADIEKSLRK